MAETIPLSARLSVQLVLVVIGNVLGQSFDLMLELLAIESGYLRSVQWQTVLLRQIELPRIRCGSSHFTGTISPVLISFEAAETRLGVSRFSLPIYRQLVGATIGLRAVD